MKYTAFAIMRSLLYPLVCVYCADLVWRSQLLGENTSALISFLENILLVFLLCSITIILYLIFNLSNLRKKVPKKLRIIETLFLITGLVIAHFNYNLTYDRYETNAELNHEFKTLEWMRIAENSKQFYPYQEDSIMQPFFRFEDEDSIDANRKLEAAKHWLVAYEEWIRNSGARFRKEPLSETEINEMAERIIADLSRKKRIGPNPDIVTAVCVYDEYGKFESKTKVYFSSKPHFDLKLYDINRPRRRYL